MHHIIHLTLKHPTISIYKYSPATYTLPGGRMNRNGTDGLFVDSVRLSDCTAPSILSLSCTCERLTQDRTYQPIV